MPARVGIGVVGAGSIGIRGALAHLALGDVQDRVFLAAVCDPVPGRATDAAKRFDVARAYERYEDLLEDAAVDAVTLCSPIGLHYEQGLKAIESGKHVHFNKTMTTTAAEATELIDRAAVAAVKLVASPGEMLRPLKPRNSPSRRERCARQDLMGRDRRGLRHVSRGGAGQARRRRRRRDRKGVPGAWKLHAVVDAQARN